jgi:Flp pilus assembly protein CpaB
VARPLPRRRRPARWRGPARWGRRSLAARWLLVAAVAGVAALQAAKAGRDAAAERDAWGSAASVVVVARPVEAGEAIGAGDVVVEQRPLAVVPDGAVAEPPLGRVATSALVPGEVVVAARLAPAGSSAVAARVPDGWRALAVATSASGFGAPAPPLAVGDRVDVLAPDVVAEDALVVAVGDAAVTIALPAGDAAAVADASAAAVVTLALRGPAG